MVLLSRYPWRCPAATEGAVVEATTWPGRSARCLRSVSFAPEPRMPSENVTSPPSSPDTSHPPNTQTHPNTHALFWHSSASFLPPPESHCPFNPFGSQRRLRLSKILSFSICLLILSTLSRSNSSSSSFSHAIFSRLKNLTLSLSK
eukprot:6194071-Pleurochrysis_carterae.AAC.2